MPIGLGETHVNNMQFGEQEQNLSIFKMLMFKTRLQVIKEAPSSDVFTNIMIT